MTDFNFKVFLAVAKMNSFTRAAEFLNLSQPAVTHQIKNLETMLQTKLFNRCQNKIFLTKSGDILLKYAEKMNTLYQGAMKEIQEVNNRVAGDVHIGAVSLLGKYLLPRVIGEFKKSHPEVNISMLVGNSKEIIEYLQNDVIELAVVSEPIPVKNLIAFSLYSDYLTIIVDTDHPWSGKKEISPADLLNEDFISREVGSGTREVYLKSLEAYVKGKQLKTVMVLGNTEAVKMAVIGKMGFSIVSRLATRSEVELGLLREVRIRNVNMSRNFFVAYKSEENLSVPALRMKEYLKSKKQEFDRLIFNRA